jgi:hypothetical protein
MQAFSTKQMDALCSGTVPKVVRTEDGQAYIAWEVRKDSSIGACLHRDGHWRTQRCYYTTPDAYAALEALYT